MLHELCIFWCRFVSIHVPVGGSKKADAAVRVGAHEADDDDSALLSLKATTREQATRRTEAHMHGRRIGKRLMRFVLMIMFCSPRNLHVNARVSNRTGVCTGKSKARTGFCDSPECTFPSLHPAICESHVQTWFSKMQAAHAGRQVTRRERGGR